MTEFTSLFHFIISQKFLLLTFSVISEVVEDKSETENGEEILSKKRGMLIF